MRLIHRCFAPGAAASASTLQRSKLGNSWGIDERDGAYVLAARSRDGELAEMPMEVVAPRALHATRSPQDASRRPPERVLLSARNEALLAGFGRSSPLERRKGAARDTLMRGVPANAPLADLLQHNDDHGVDALAELPQVA
jgi:hypothetical protein